MRQALEILLRRKKVFLIPFLVAFCVPAIVALLFMRTYEADSLVWLDSDVTLIPVLNETSQPDQKPIQRASDSLQQLLQTRSFVTALTKRTPLRSRMDTARGREQTIAYVRKNLRAEIVGVNSLRISYAGASSGEAVTVAAAATDSFVSWLRSEVKKQNDATVKFFEAQVSRYEKELALASDAVRAFREQHPEVRELEIRDKVLAPPSVTLSADLQTRFEQLKADEEYARKVYDGSLDDLAKGRVQAAAREERYANGLRVVDKPVAPTGFAKKRMLLADFLAFCAAVLIGTTAVALVELTDRTFHARHEVEETLDLPVLVEAGREERKVSEV